MGGTIETRGLEKSVRDTRTSSVRFTPRSFYLVVVPNIGVEMFPFRILVPLIVRTRHYPNVDVLRVTKLRKQTFR